ncbi:MAG: hypothetical protein DRP11_02195 [Candidatus Aenigmatarchaeota archaeon]|nr:MAG: hypothetical protein DRP11_02195 [Candidatus Aenigmarchaeota archaeon]
MEREGLKAQAEVLIYEHRKGRKVLIHRQKLNTFTMNFIHTMEFFLKGVSADTGLVIGLTDLTGASQNVQFQGPHDPSGGSYLATETTGKSLPVRIRIGSSDAPESRDDYKLGDEKMAESATVITANSTVKASASFTPTEDIIVREVGLSKSWRKFETGDVYEFLLLRGVISERTFSAGTTYTVEIRINFT